MKKISLVLCFILCSEQVLSTQPTDRSPLRTGIAGNFIEVSLLLGSRLYNYMTGYSSSSSQPDLFFVRSERGVEIPFSGEELSFLRHEIPQLFSANRTSSSALFLHLLSYIARDNYDGFRNFILNVPSDRFNSLMEEVAEVESPYLTRYYMDALRERYKRNMRYVSNLEDRYVDQWFQYVDIYKNSRFRDCRVANEFHPENISAHLQPEMLGEGELAVTVGSERSFFFYLFAPVSIRKLLIRDIHPQVLAYNHFNTLLLRISDSREEYRRLTFFLLSKEYKAENEEKLSSYIYEVKQKILQNKTMNENIKAFYLLQLKTFARSFYEKSRVWKTKYRREFQLARYDLDQGQFYKLHHAAKNGNIVITAGSIFDLEFIEEPIVAIDSSNIRTYEHLDFKFSFDMRPRIIWTYLPLLHEEEKKTVYKSYIHEPLDNLCDREEYFRLIENIGKALPETYPNPIMRLAELNYKVSDDFYPPLSSISHIGLEEVRAYHARLFQLEGFGIFIFDIDFVETLWISGGDHSIQKLMKALEKESFGSRQVLKFLIMNWESWDENLLKELQKIKQVNKIATQYLEKDEVVKFYKYIFPL